jgi:multidrug efflux pump
MFQAATVTGAALPGVSTGDVLGAMEALSDKELPRSMTSEWTELSFLQKQSSKVEQFRDLRQNPFSAFVLGAVLVFFVLAGLYESWSLPLAVILVVPMCVLSALAGIALAQMDVNIFVQVGFVVLVGLACKNAILIVEFARDRQQDGASRFAAAVEAARVRLRPIIMTSFAFILGVFPLVIAEGAGAEMRRTLGTAVFAGMIGVTLFGIFLTPVFYSVVRWFSGRGLATPESVPAHGSPDGAHTVPTERAGSPGRGEAVRLGEEAQTPAAGGRGDHRGADAVPGDPRLDRQDG